MRFLLIMHMNPGIWESLSEDQQNSVFQGHGDFMKLVSESGEMVETKAIGDPSRTRTVRVRDGVVKAVDGPVVEAESFVCGFYLVDVSDEARAVELAGLIPDAMYTAVEVRPVVHEAGPA